MDRIAYLNQPNCGLLSNGTVEVIVTTDVGPRVIRYAFPGEENILAELPDIRMTTALGEWRAWGGHRLWAAPEAMPRSYAPDNVPVESTPIGSLGVRLTAPVEPGAGIQKEIELSLDSSGSSHSDRVTIRHRITNHNLWGIELAPWALTIMRGEGVTIVPQEPYRSHDDYLLPARPMVLWHFTDLSDPRWILGKRYVRLQSMSDREEPQKIGFANRQGWMAYHCGGTLFVKTFEYIDGAPYPDYGCNCETYTAGSFMEVESLGPLQYLEPGESADHVETWRLFRNVDLGDTEDAIHAALDGRVPSAPG